MAYPTAIAMPDMFFREVPQLKGKNPLIKGERFPIKGGKAPNYKENVPILQDLPGYFYVPSVTFS
ncbi:hypothetical protein ACSAZK_05070 [Methanosarcina sp. Mfa9]|uniref:hypothetical protein n=1 Tax=Methanosarcina sp. Mfa9 TaxID=3439063 RepID=UPI003F855206